jgi:hypothetical protein
MRVGDFGLMQDVRFVGGLIAGAGIGGLLGYGLAWDRVLGFGPGVMALLFLPLVGIGQWIGWAAARRRGAGEEKLSDAAQGAAPDGGGK